MQINLNPTSERGASRDAVNRPRETLGDSHLISSDPRSRFGLVCDLLCCRGNNSRIDNKLQPLVAVAGPTSVGSLDRVGGAANQAQGIDPKRVTARRKVLAARCGCSKSGRRD